MTTSHTDYKKQAEEILKEIVEKYVGDPELLSVLFGVAYSRHSLKEVTMSAMKSRNLMLIKQLADVQFDSIKYLAFSLGKAMDFPSLEDLGLTKPDPSIN